MSLRILIIKDEAIIGINIKRAITSMGHKVLMVVENSSDALKIAQKNKIDLLIFVSNIKSDTDLVECSSILQNFYHIPVLFITKYGDAKRVQKAVNINFIGCLEKPFRKDELETMINVAV